MTCSANALKRFPEDNKQIAVVIRDQSGDRIPGLQADVSEIIFQAKNKETDAVLIDLRESAGKITLTEINDESGDTQDVVTIIPTTDDMDVPPDEYNIFLQLTLVSPARIFYVDMEKDNNPLTELIILEGGITP